MASISPSNVPASESADDGNGSHTENINSSTTQPPPPSTTTTAEAEAETDTRRCFVCLVDEPADSLSPADWSTPCECTLEGHQACLLAWVADLEAQQKEVRCPVCKAAIVVTERYDAAVRLADALVARFSRWSPCVLLGFLGAGALVSSSAYGLKAISWFAGPEAALDFLVVRQRQKRVEGALFGLWNRRGDTATQAALKINLLHVGVLPLIAPALVLNRLSSSDIVLLPASLIYVTLFNPSYDFLTWPPAPEQVIGLFPAVKSTYYHLHRAVSKKLEKSWAARARALSAQQQGSDANYAMQDVVAQPPEPAMNILDLEIDIQIGGDPAEGGEEGEGNADGDNVPGAGGAAGIPWPRTSTDPINFLAGSLLFPSVCYGAGEILRLILPSRLTTKSPSSSLLPTGLLEERWGRSLVGGCLFVVLKDAFFLYVKYRKMMNFPYRRVKNSEKRHVRR
ncbi:hypothetical protein F5Y17DRAFT_440966 [Xylariaceae sp. FL0594]|nr:hypothetical protein F5Y17DRAFT_440966 [Xylariaceae sp. FL0594]